MPGMSTGPPHCCDIPQFHEGVTRMFDCKGREGGGKRRKLLQGEVARIALHGLALCKRACNHWERTQTCMPVAASTRVYMNTLGMGAAHPLSVGLQGEHQGAVSHSEANCPSHLLNIDDHCPDGVHAVRTQGRWPWERSWWIPSTGSKNTWHPQQ
jgi:hypothetical protein